MYHPPKDWSHLIADYKTGDFSHGDLAERYSISRHHVSTILKRAGVPARDPKSIKRNGIAHEKVLRVYREGGRSSRGMAELLGVTPQTIYKVLKKHKVKLRFPHGKAKKIVPLTEEQEQNILKMFEEEVCLSIIAKKLDVPRKSVNTTLVKHNAYAESRFAEYKDEWVFFHKNGMNIRKISQFSGISEDDISNTLKCAGVEIRTGHRRNS